MIPKFIYEIIKGKHQVSKNVDVVVKENFIKINQSAINADLTVFLTYYELKAIYDLVFSDNKKENEGG